MKRPYKIFLAIFGILSFGGFVFAQQTFYEAYEEGVAHYEKGDYDRAEAFFIRASELKPTPGKNVKKYGLNFIKEYDPYYFLANVHLKKEQLEEAEQFLTKSIQAQVMRADALEKLERSIAELRGAGAKNQVASANEPEPVRQSKTEPPKNDAVPHPSKAPQEHESSGESNKVNVQAVLDVQSSPLGANVLVEGVLRGKTPIKIMLDPGKITVTVVLNGYKEMKRTIKLERGQESQEVFYLTKVNPTVIDSKPAEQPISVAEKRQQDSPLDNRSKVQEPETSTMEQMGSEGDIPLDKPDGGELNANVGPEEHLTVSKPQEKEASSSKTIILLLLVALLGLVAFLIWQNRRTGRELDSTRKALNETMQMERNLATEQSLTIAGLMVEKTLGRGNMGTTFLVRKTDSDGPLAAKVLHNHLLDDHDIKKRFIREGQLGTSLHHPNIIRIFQAGEDSGIPYIVMEYLNGKTLEEHLSPNLKLPLEKALVFTRSVATALDYAHLKGVVHRDLKPENLMVMDEKSIKVMDFGIAKISDIHQTSATQSFIGTPAYSAPELVTPEEIGPESDLYSLGIILYRMLSGTVPFQGTNPLDVLQQHIRDPLPPLKAELDVPDIVWSILCRLTAKRKQDRYANAESLINEIDAFSAQQKR